MARIKLAGNKADKFVASVRNGEASASIPKGTPVMLNLSTTAGTDDGLSVVLPNTAGNPNSYGLRFGVVTDTLTAGQYGETILFGVASYALVTRATRAGTATSDSWTSSASIASGVALGVDTANNAFLIGATIAGSIASNGRDAVLLDSIASMAASATTTADARTAITANVRVFVRMM